MWTVDHQLADKQDRLHARLRTLDRLIVAYSGGVDSTFLAAAARRALGDRCLAVTAISPSLAERERQDAASLAARLGWNHLEIETHELDREAYARNRPDRCYWCKTELFEVLAPLARRHRAPIAVGTNLDDLGDHRPGLTAAQRHGVLAPLVDAGLTKADVRQLSALLGLPTADKPASPCLASRFAYGVRVTPAGLRRVDRAEEALRGLGFGVLRVRDHGDLARIEVPPADIPRAAALGARIGADLLSLGFRYVTIDLVGFRSGSLNEVLPAPRLRRPEETGSGPTEGP
jgi:pyridinium-3,5-biscarboxylic acid mononucleotide sulfurtransferase